MTGGLSADGNMLVISQMTSGKSPEVLVGIKVGWGIPTGPYTTVGYGYDSAGDSSDLYELTFSGGYTGQYYGGRGRGSYSYSLGDRVTLFPWGGNEFTYRHWRRRQHARDRSNDFPAGARLLDRNQIARGRLQPMAPLRRSRRALICPIADTP